MFRSNLTRYREIINNAIQADKVVRDKFDNHRQYMEILSRGPGAVESALPSAGGSDNVANTSAVVTLRQLMEQVETIKAERETIESELKSATIDMKDSFLGALAKDGAINEPAISFENLGQTYGPLQKQVAESVEKQGSLIERIKVS